MLRVQPIPVIDVGLCQNSATSKMLPLLTSGYWDLERFGHWPTGDRWAIKDGGVWPSRDHGTASIHASDRWHAQFR